MTGPRHDLDPAVAAQLAAMRLAPARPLIVCDADEVLLQFVRGLEGYLETLGLWLDLQSYALTGNIKRRADGAALAAAEVRDLIAAFFAERIGHLEPVDGAAAALRALAERCQIVVLSNVPAALGPARRAALVRHGMDYPVIANTGAKGAAVARLAGAVRGPVFFIDDIPSQIEAVAALAGEVIRLHFVADPRLARLIGPAPAAHARHDDWPSARAYIEERLRGLGY